MSNVRGQMSNVILVTGAAGFIGFHTARRLLDGGVGVVGIDNFNDSYDVSLKEARAKILSEYPSFEMHRGDIEDRARLHTVFQASRFDRICHLAARAGVRESLLKPEEYVRSNVLGFITLLEEARASGIRDIVYASTSAVYGDTNPMPLREDMRTDSPSSLYAATKKADEEIAYTYHHLYKMNFTGLRFFTVYGPFGRPDMELFLFTKNILEDRPIPVFGEGKMRRDFTYIDDIVDGVIASLEKPFPYEIINLGRGASVALEDFIPCIERCIGKRGEREYASMQPGDVRETHADISKARRLLGYESKISIEEGVKRFVEWYKGYYRI